MTALSWDLCPVYPCGLYAALHRSAECAGLRMSHSDIFCAREKCGGPKILFPTLLLKCVLVDSFFRHAFAFRRCCCPASSVLCCWRRLFLHNTPSLVHSFGFCCSSYTCGGCRSLLLLPSFTTELFQASTKRWLSSCPPFSKTLFSAATLCWNWLFNRIFPRPTPLLATLELSATMSHALTKCSSELQSHFYTRVMQLFPQPYLNSDLYSNIEQNLLEFE